METVDLKVSAAALLGGCPDEYVWVGKALVHESVVILEDVTLGTGVIIGPFCKIPAFVAIGDATVLHDNVVLSTLAEVGERCILFSGVMLGVNCKVGDDVRMHVQSHLAAGGKIGNRCEIGPHVALVGSNVKDDTSITWAGKVTRL